MVTHLHSLIPVQQQQDGGLIQTVNARELHAFLEVRTRFNDWIRDRIEHYLFIENQDFAIITENPVKIGRGRPSVEYHLSIVMAKKLAMVERTPKGDQARDYFIACEEKLKEVLQAPAPLPNFSDPVLAARAWADAKEALQLAEAKVLQDAPKVAFHDAVVETEGTYRLDVVHLGYTLR